MTGGAMRAPGATRRTVIVIPAFNERDSLPGLIDELRLVADIDVVVVDDGSTDGTSEVARALGVPAITLPFNLGVGGATRAGLQYARRQGYAAAVQCDADGQHPPESIRTLVQGLDEADIVIGARFAGVGDYEAGGPRLWAMRLLAWVFSRIHGTELTDVTSGFRAFGPRAIRILSTEMPPEYLGDTVEVLVIAKQHGLGVRQTPVAMRRRSAGAASHGALKSTVFLFRVMLMLALSLVSLVGRRRPESAA